MSQQLNINTDGHSSASQQGNLVVTRRAVVNTQAASAPTPNAVESVESIELIQKLRTAAVGSKDLQTLLGQINLIIGENTDCLAVWYANREASDAPFKIHSIACDDSASVLEIAKGQLDPLVKAAAEKRQIFCAELAIGQHTLMTAPVQQVLSDADDPANSVLAACFSSKDQSKLRQQWMMGIVCQTMTSWFQNNAQSKLAHKAKCLNDALSLNAAMNRSKSCEEAAMVLVNYLRQMCDAGQVVFTRCVRKDLNRLTAISDVEQIDENSEASMLMANATEQALVAGRTLHFPNAEDENSPASLALESYCRANRFEACVNVPISNSNDEPIGALLIAVDQAQLTEQQLEYFNQISSLNGSHLDVINRANLSLREIAKNRFAELKKRNWVKAAFIGVACLIGLMMVPMPYRVGCDCEIQPVTRRFVAAPYNGILEKSIVETGDIVRKDQILAYMDGRQLRMELSAIEAEFGGAKRQRDSSLAIGEVAQSQIARSEMKRLSSKMTMLNDQLKNLEIRSPHDGIIVSGDLEKAEGAPLELGKTLFEVAPLESMLSEVAIPESEIQYVKENDEVKIKLTAFPFRTWVGTIKKIHPRTEVINDESVFIADVEMPNEDTQIRPGMKGSAKIKTRLRPIGWNLFHSAWESVRCWTIW